MLKIKTIVKPSELEGLGLFTAEDISKGTPVWVFDSRFDLFFDLEDVKEMDDLQKDFIDRYAYLSTESGKYVLCADDVRFMNHSATKNNLDTISVEDEPETRAVANRDIKEGEEILINYREIDKFDAESEDKYLNE